MGDSTARDDPARADHALDTRPLGHSIRTPLLWAGTVASVLGFAAGVLTLGTQALRGSGFWHTLLMLPLMGLVAGWLVRLLWNRHAGRQVAVPVGPRIIVGGALLAFALATFLQPHPSTLECLFAGWLAWWGLKVLWRVPTDWP